MGLLELTPGGRARLIPIAILIDGKFYDASGYKASPVPMALWAETVYEGFRTGVSEGLFTVTGALQNQATKDWLAEGTWQPAGSVPAKTAKKSVSSVPKGLDDDAGPPVLRHGGNAVPKPPEPAAAPASTNPAGTASSSSQQTNASPDSSSGSTAQSSRSSSATTAATAPPTASSDQEAENDTDRPTLKRGKPALKAQQSTSTAKATTAAKTTQQAASPAPAETKAATPPAASQIQLIPAISDADGPEMHSYAFPASSEETEQFRKKMLALTADEIRARAKQLGSEAVGVQTSKTPGKANSAKQVQPSFEDVQLRVFDLSSSNEPILILTAEAHMPASDLQYIVSLVAREDINGDFHKALANVTDNEHLDVLPHLELIDAVDADGDGRGELLFRKVSDSSSAYVIYRVIGDQLYPLFEGEL